MARREFQAQLRDLRNDTREMGMMVDRAVARAMDALRDRAVARAMDALRDRDVALASAVIRDDNEIDRTRYEIEEACTELIALESPTAGDLRLVLSVFAIITDLERMADHAEGIASIVVAMQDEPLVKPLVDLPEMAERAREMLRTAVDAFATEDVDAARRVGAADDEVDRLKGAIYRDLIEVMIADPALIEPATQLVWVSHNLERIADRATNIAERVIFTATGRISELGGRP